MITNRHHAETMPDLYFPPSYRYARPSLPQTRFWTQGHPVSFSQGTLRILNAAHRDP